MNSATETVTDWANINLLPQPNDSTSWYITIASDMTQEDYFDTGLRCLQDATFSTQDECTQRLCEQFRRLSPSAHHIGWLRGIMNRRRLGSILSGPFSHWLKQTNHIYRRCPTIVPIAVAGLVIVGIAIEVQAQWSSKNCSSVIFRLVHNIVLTSKKPSQILPPTSSTPSTPGGLGFSNTNNATDDATENMIVDDMEVINATDDMTEDMTVDDMEVQNTYPTRTTKTITTTVTDLNTNKKTTKMTKLTVKEPQAKKGTGKRKRGANEEVARKRKRVAR